MADAVIDKNLVRTWIELERSALAHNLGLIRRLLPSGCRLMAVAKSNAYGHGIYNYVPSADELGADWLGVDSIVEAVTLREIGIDKPVLVLGYTLPGRIADAARHGVSLTISSFDSLAALGRSGVEDKIGVHFKIDTGLHRQGFLPAQVPELVALLRRDHPGLGVEGLYTHFASAKDPDDTAYTRGQIEAFRGAVEVFRVAGYKPLLHVCATAGVFLYPDVHYDMVRVGIGLLGLWPSITMKPVFEGSCTLRPVLSWRTIISEVKRLPAGARIGYDLTEELARNSVVGVCPVGYWHGFPRSLSRVGEVLVRGRRARVLGNVTMDMITIDLTDIPAAGVEDTVTIIGRDGGENVTVYELAGRAGQSYYEFLTRLNPLIQKYVLAGNQAVERDVQ